MTADGWFVSGVLAVAVVLFASDRVRLDLVAILALLALLVAGILTPGEALAGFGDPLVLMIAGLFVVGEGLFRTGVAYAVGDWVVRAAGSNETRILVLLMLVVALLSAVMSSTGAVAIFIPVVLSLAAKGDIAPSRLLMPVAYASLIGGMLTLIGTPPNMVVSAELERHGAAPFGFFEFTPIGLLVLVVGIVYMAVAGRRLLSPAVARTADAGRRLTLTDLAAAYGMAGRWHRLAVTPESGLIGLTVSSARLRHRYDVNVVGLARQATLVAGPIVPAAKDVVFQAGDALFVAARAQSAATLARDEGLEIVPVDPARSGAVAKDLGLVEVLVAPQSVVIGQSVFDYRFRSQHQLTVLAIRRDGQTIVDDVASVPLRFGDSLLVGGGWAEIDRLQERRDDFLVLNLPAEHDAVAPARRLAPVAIALVLGMIALMTLNLMAAVTAVLVTATAMIVTRCVSMDDVYRAINWQSLVLIAGMLPMATALEQTGVVTAIVHLLVGGLGEFGPVVSLVGLFVLTSVFSQFISNTATTVVVAPIAVGVAAGMAVSPLPLLMTVAVAASTAFATPIASPVNTLVLGPGGYRFNDFVKLGVPLQVLSLAVTVLVVPVLFPF